MPSGGYKVYDCKRRFASYPMGIEMPGLYDFIESSNGKPILLKNIMLGDSYVSAVYAAFRSVGTAFVSILNVTLQGNGVLKVGVLDSDIVYFANLDAQIPPANSMSASSDDYPSASM